MRLIDPVDFKILSYLEEGRNTPANMGIDLDESRNYLSNRLRQLQEYDLVRHVGPSDRSGLFELTDRGAAALAHRDDYDRETADAFAARLDTE